MIPRKLTFLDKEKPRAKKIDYIEDDFQEEEIVRQPIPKIDEGLRPRNQALALDPRQEQLNRLSAILFQG